MIVRSEFRDLETPSGPMRTHVYAPAGGGPYPGLVLYPEIFQQTGPIARLSAQFAGHGYVVAAPEIWHEHEPPGTVLGYDDAGKDKGNAYKKKTKLKTFDDDLRVLIAFLQQHPQCNGRIGATGFCIGGHLAFRAALQPEVLATVAFYGTDIHSGTDTLARCGEIRGEVAMIWGRHDPHIPAEGRRTIYDALSAAGVRFTWHEFVAEHAFMRDEGPRYDPEAARMGVQIALTTFARTL